MFANIYNLSTSIHLSIGFHVSYRANVKYCLSFASQGKQTSVFRIYLYWNGSIYIPTYMYLAIYISISIFICPYLYIYTYIYICCRFKRKTKAQAFFPWHVYCLLIVQIKVRHLSARLRKNKEKLFICKRTKRTCPSMHLSK